MADGTRSPPSKSLPLIQPKSTTAVAGSKTRVHVTALDGIVTVNSLFTIALFIGFSFTTPSVNGAGNTPSCTPTEEIARRVILFEVIAFSCFLFSSLIAQSLKLAINLVNALSTPEDPHTADMDSFCMKYGLVGSAIGSVSGCMFLTLSLVWFIQVKLGTFGCSGESVAAVVILVSLVGCSLSGYILTGVYVICFM